MKKTCMDIYDLFRHALPPNFESVGVWYEINSLNAAVVDAETGQAYQIQIKPKTMTWEDSKVSA